MANKIQRPNRNNEPREGYPAPAAVPEGQPQTPPADNSHEPERPAQTRRAGKNDTLPALRITLLGGTGTGKSTFIAGLIETFANLVYPLGSGSAARISLKLLRFRSSDSIISISEVSAEDAAVDSLMLTHHLDEFSFFRDGAALRFPEGTTGNSKSYTFLLQVNGTDVCRLIIMDYMGGYIDHPEMHSRQEMQMLGESCAASDAVIIMADTTKLVADLSDGVLMPDAAHFHMNSAQINQLIYTISDHSESPVTVLFALTKSDQPAVQACSALCSEHFRAAADMLRSIVYSGAYNQLLVRRDWWYGIIPVTAVGPDKVDEYNRIKPGAVIKQENIDLSLLFCLMSHLERMIAGQQAQVSAAKRRRFDLGHLLTAIKEFRIRRDACLHEIEVLDALHLLKNQLDAQMHLFLEAMPLIRIPKIGEIGGSGEGGTGNDA